MAEDRTFAELFGPKEESDEATKKTIQTTGRAFMLRLRFKKRLPAGVAWGTFDNFDMEPVKGEKGEWERLTLIFFHVIVIIEGYCLEKILDDCETERTMIVNEMAPEEVTKERIANQTAVGAAIKAAVISIDIKPNVKTRIDAVIESQERQGEDREPGLPSGFGPS